MMTLAPSVISWSGPTSKALAEILRGWLPAVIQAVKPYYSSDDVTKGTRWNAEITKELSDARVGIICLTRDNLTSPWILFEAGALSKNIDDSRVVPLLFGLQPTDVQYPLATFQTAQFEKAEMKRVVTMINTALGEQALSSNVLDNVFDMWWPNLEQKVNEQLTAVQEIQKAQLSEVRSERDLLEEILAISRETAQTSQGLMLSPMSSAVVFDLVNSFSKLVNDLVTPDVDNNIVFKLREIRAPISHIVRRTIFRPGDGSEVLTLLDNITAVLDKRQIKFKLRTSSLLPPNTDDEDLPF